MELPDILNVAISELPEGTTYAYDSVGNEVSIAQKALDYLGYEGDRNDGYFTHETEECIKTFQKDHELEVTGIMDKTTFQTLISSVTFDWSTNKTNDTQLQYA